MIASSLRARPRALPLGLLGMLALVVVLESAIVRKGVDLLETTLCAAKLASRAVRTKASECEVLCFGDSLMKLGVAPSVLEERLRSRSYNLALTAGRSPGTFALLRQALDSGARPAAVLVDFMPFLQAFELGPNAAQFSEILGIGDTIELGWTARDAGLAADIFAHRILPSYHRRWQIREAVGMALKGQSDGRGTLNRAYVNHFLRNRGAELEPRNRGFDTNPDVMLSVSWQDRERAYPEHWSCGPTTRLYMERFFALAASRGIRVFWLLPPRIAGIQAQCEANGLEARYLQLVSEIQARFPNVVVLDARKAGYPVWTFVDASHMNQHGVVTLSNDVADALDRFKREGWTGPRWVTLPKFRERPVSEDHELAAAILARSPIAGENR